MGSLPNGFVVSLFRETSIYFGAGRGKKESDRPKGNSFGLMKRKCLAPGGKENPKLQRGK